MTPRAAFVLFSVVLAEVSAALALAPAAGLTLADLVDAFVVTNLVIGLSCGVAGFLIAWQRPANPVGRLLLGAAVCQSTSGVGVPLSVAGAAAGWPEPVLRTTATLVAYAWPFSIAVFLPLALLAFPDGLLPGRIWRAPVVLALVNAPLFALDSGAEPGGTPIDPWLVLPGYAALAPLWTLAEIANLVVFVSAVVGLVIRYRRGDEQRRRQLLWLVWALVGVVVMMVPWGLFGLGPVLQLLAIALVPTAIAIAVLRHQLLDIRLVLSRTVVYVLLSAAVVGILAGLVAAAGGAVGGADRETSVLVTVLVAVAFEPVRRRLQRRVDRALYGDRDDPVRALGHMGGALRSADDLAGVCAAVCAALRLPAAAVVRGGVELAGSGTWPDGTGESVALVSRGEAVGELRVGVRRGEGGLSRADRAALEVLAAPIAVAVHATALSEAVQRSRTEIVAAREEERRRLRHDLHDGLGPALTGISFQADAAGNLVAADPAAASRVLAALRAAATDAIADVRRIVYGLRPPALDELGLVEALRRHAAQLPAVTVVAPELPPLPAAVESIAYRIAVEALTNAVRHGAGPVEVRLDLTDHLQLTVSDAGPPGPVWRPGVGLTSMRERAAELGGTLDAGPTPTGGRVVAHLPRAVGPVDLDTEERIDRSEMIR
ncbi:sensor histidine kinase [Pseudonocardia oroxyli]|uniref:histidine kinase n=1 Tax=Pseudonocardia oroxyli TaxID=366584 RepID=A0A1G7E087_PSEOR|nr:histidine kinase [Pseudonocardia oroxyli]SDE57148.1 Histidine kinase [Pseudonocardia oroxyli]